jgi:hypothetical protein
MDGWIERWVEVAEVLSTRLDSRLPKLEEKHEDSTKHGNTSTESYCEHDGSMRESLGAGGWVPLCSKHDNIEARAMLLKANPALQPYVAGQGNRVGESDI